MWTLLGLVALLSLIAAGLLMEEIIRPLQTLANVVSALRESDYSFRARGGRQLDALGELAIEINEFADMLQSQRLGELEAAALLRCVISSMDAPVLAFDPEHRLRLINPAGERIFHLNAARALGCGADELQLAALLDQPDQGIMVLAGKGNPVQWMVRRSSFRQRGIPHTLLVLSDVSIALREQERDAWQRLIRVIGHEINNSLTPIKSIAGSLRSWIHINPLRVHTMAETTSEDEVFSLDRGLKIIENRAESLNRFIQAYRQLAQLPPPALQPVSLHSLMERAVGLETRVAVQLNPGPDLVLQLDPDQIEQLIINLLRNAAEAALMRFAEAPANGNVTITWRATAPDGDHIDRGQRDWPHQSVESICALLHHEARRERYRTRPGAADLRSPRGRSSGRQPPRCSGLQSRDPPALDPRTGRSARAGTRGKIGRDQGRGQLDLHYYAPPGIWH